MFTVEYLYKISDKYSGPLGKIKRKTDKFKRSVVSTSTALKGMTTKLGVMGRKMAGLKNIVGGAALIFGMFKFTKSASDLEDKMADVQRVTDLSGKRLKVFQKLLQKMGRETGKSALGLAEIAYEGGKLNIPTDKLAAFVLMVTKTASSFDMLESEAGSSIGQIKTKMGLTVSETEKLMNRVNFLADNTTATGSRMIEVIQRVSGTFKTLHVPIEVAAGWAGFADQIEVTGRLAASGLNQMMQKMITMPGMMDKMLKDPTGAIKNYLNSFTKMPETVRAKKILKIFGDEAGRFVLKAVTNLDLLDEAMKKAASKEALGSMDREWANILARSSTAGKKIKETSTDISRAIGIVFLRMFDKYSDRLIKMSEGMLKFTKANPGLIKTLGILAALTVAVFAIIIPLGFLAMSIEAIAAVLTSTAFLAVIGAIGWCFTAAAIPVNVFAIAIGAVALAVYRLVKNWDALTAPGFLKDMGGWISQLWGGGKIDMGGSFGGDSIGKGAADQKSKGQQQNNKLGVDGTVKIETPKGTTASGSIALNTGSNIMNIWGGMA